MVEPGLKRALTLRDGAVLAMGSIAGPGMRFLDVAAGSGALSIPAARLDAQVLSTDMSSVMLERLKVKRVFGLGETLATTLMGLATRIAAKITAYTYAFLINRRMGRSQGRSRTCGPKKLNKQRLDGMEAFRLE